MGAPEDRGGYRSGVSDSPRKGKDDKPHVVGEEEQKMWVPGEKMAGEIVCVFWQEMNNIQRICKMPH